MSVFVIINFITMFCFHFNQFKLTIVLNTFKSFICKYWNHKEKMRFSFLSLSFPLCIVSTVLWRYIVWAFKGKAPQIMVDPHRKPCCRRTVMLYETLNILLPNSSGFCTASLKPCLFCSQVLSVWMPDQAD